jgi:predicted Zn-dependent peptidase
MTFNIKNRTLDNGLQIYHFKVPTSTICISSFIFSGTYFEKPEEYGISHFIEHMLFKGTNKRKDRSEIYDEMSTYFGNFACNTTKERIFLGYNVQTEEFDHSLEFMTDLFFNSRFDKKEIEKEKEIVIREIKERNDNVSTILYEVFFESLYPKTPICISPAGTEEIVRNLYPKRIKEKYKEDYNPANMAIFITSPLRHRKIFSKIKQYFGKYEGTNKNSLPKFNIIKGPVQRLELRNLSSLHYACGKDLNIKTEEKIPLQLAVNTLSKIITNEILNNNPLSYSRTTDIIRSPYTNSLYITATIDPKNMNLVRDLIKSSIDKIQKGKISEKEFFNTKKQNHTWYRMMGPQSLTAYAFQYWYYNQLNQFLEYEKNLEKTKLEDVIKTAKKHLKTERLTETFVGNFQNP